MFFEYALEPQVVATWAEQKNYRFFKRAFEFGQGRLVSRYPKSWFRRVLESIEPAPYQERERVVELLKELKHSMFMVKRLNSQWDNRYNWLQNTLIEHKRFPFHAILAQAKSNCPNVITEDDIVGYHNLWDLPHDIPVRRNAEEIIRTIPGIFYYSRWIKFIDPYISKGSSGYRKSISTFLAVLATDRPVGPPVSVEIHSKDCDATKEWLTQFYTEILPGGLEVEFFVWREKDSGQKFHNRYILTDIGGVSFGHGLDEGKEAEMDHLTRLGQEQYDLCCKQYNKNSHAFDLVYNVSI